METIRKIIREELESIITPTESSQECDMSKWLDLLNCAEKAQESNRNLQNLVEEIKRITESPEPDNIKLEKINTAILLSQNFPDP